MGSSMKSSVIIKININMACVVVAFTYFVATVANIFGYL